MSKKAFIFPILAISLLILLFIGCIWGANLPISSQTSYLLFIITSLFIIISSATGVIQNINIIMFKKNIRPTNISLLIVCIIVFIFTILWLLIILDFQSYNPNSIIYKLFRKP